MAEGGSIFIKNNINMATTNKVKTIKASCKDLGRLTPTVATFASRLGCPIRVYNAGGVLHFG